jgi:hypothetical protein
VNRFQNQNNNITLQPGRWYLFEWYVKLNRPGVSDGVTRLWIDDASQPIARQTLRLEYDDMRWRQSHDAGKRFGFVRLTAYHQRCDLDPNTCPPNGPAILDQSQRWDHLVVSRRPIGPLQLSPVCTGAYPVVTPSWFQNRRAVAVTIGGVTDPRQQPVTITVERVRATHGDEDSSEHERDDDRNRRAHRDDDDRAAHIVIEGGTVFVTAWAEGRRHRQSYTIDFVARNLDGLECTSSVRFRAPFDERRRER